MDMTVGSGMGSVAASGDLGDLLEARRRIVAAFEGIAAGAEALAAHAERAEALDRVQAELEEERKVTAQLEARIHALREREGGRGALEAELARLRAEVASLREQAEAKRHELDAVLSELIPLVEEAR